MHANRLIACCGIIAATLGVLGSSGLRGASPEQEHNAWPVAVRETDAKGHVTQWTGAGPFLFERPADEGGTIGGLRPIWVQRNDPTGAFRAGYFLYPVFSYRVDGGAYQWNVLELIRRSGRFAGAPAPLSRFDQDHKFEVWPFWFSRQTADPDTTYHALFPIAGTIKHKIGFDRATWVAFPLYIETEKRGVTTTSVPWPIVRITSGAAHGFGIWPLFETKERPGVWRQQYFLWPLGYNNTTYPNADAAPGTPPTRDIGALPFYARRTGPGYIDQNVLWPFFGYTDRTQPTRYHENRYFWPLLVQGRGDTHYVNRWGPVYTHSVMNGYDKTWYAWPLVRKAQWTDRGLTLSKTQVFFFVYWSEHQKSIARPNAPEASLTHLWPLYSAWNNGAGRQQLQIFSPLDVFFSGNEKVSTAWSPFFAVARYEQTSPGESRTSLLWNAVTWRRDDAEQKREFHVGPLFSVASQAATRRVAIGNGLVSFRRDADAHWKILWLDFPSKNTSSANRSR